MTPLVFVILLLSFPTQASTAPSEGWLFGDKVSDNAIYNFLDPSVTLVAISVADPTDVMSIEAPVPGLDVITAMATIGTKQSLAATVALPDKITVVIAGWGRDSQGVPLGIRRS